MLVGDDALGSGLEADKHAVGMVLCHRREDPADDVVPPRGRPPGEDDTETPGLTARLASGDDFQQPVLADEGQLLLGHLEDVKFIAVQGPGCGPTRSQG